MSGCTICAPLSCHDGASAYRYVAGPKTPEHRLHDTVPERSSRVNRRACSSVVGSCTFPCVARSILKLQRLGIAVHMFLYMNQVLCFWLDLGMWIAKRGRRDGVRQTSNFAKKRQNERLILLRSKMKPFSRRARPPRDPWPFARAFCCISPRCTTWRRSWPRLTARA